MPNIERSVRKYNKKTEDMTIREHKLRKRVVFSLDMVSFLIDFYLQCHRRV